MLDDNRRVAPREIDRDARERQRADGGRLWRRQRDLEPRLLADLGVRRPEDDVGVDCVCIYAQVSAETDRDGGMAPYAQIGWASTRSTTRGCLGKEGTVLYVMPR